ncbi:hypothetical protein [Jiella avicenniae]|uniref:Uncharacterized protein n=1 Tax=Jiella avicenniae TaxID=2907202 RepID=A0A9X1P398_9HYPH|nr:hypothetical protein [Jiella avicenniae]MCE7028939.1 hypothetical protein [Jiella avicenniae]
MISTRHLIAKPVDEIRPGEIFYGKFRQETVLCLALCSETDDSFSHFAVLSPGHPDMPGIIGILSKSVLAIRRVLELRSATLVPSVSLPAVDPSPNTFYAPVNALLMQGSELFINAQNGPRRNETIFLRTHDGRPAQLELHHTVLFTEWGVYAPDVNEKLVKVAHISPPSAE